MGNLPLNMWGSRQFVSRGTSFFIAVVYTFTLVCSVVVLHPIKVKAAAECDPGLTPKTTGDIANGDFSARPFPEAPAGNVGYDNSTTVNYGTFLSQAYNIGYDSYPSDVTPQRNQFSIQDGNFFEPGPAGLDQVTFPGDTAYGIDPTNTWYYSNGNALNGTEYINWEQDVPGLLPNRQYVFVAYITNLIEISVNNADDPEITLKIGGTSGQTDGTAIWGPNTLDEASTGNSQPNKGWQRVAAAFTTDSTGAVDGSGLMKLKIIDSARSINGDDFGITAVTLQLCEPVKDGWASIMRTYGNDVYAGGGYFDGSTCVSQGPALANPAIKGFGRFNPPSPADHSTYSGSASELGVFTPGEITGFLPGGNMNVARSALWELSFANTIDNGVIKKSATALGFGGGFGTPFCPIFPSPVSPQLRNGATLNISSLPSGDYVVNRPDVDIIAPTPISDGTHIRIFTDGNATIRTNISYANVGAGWATANDIPLVEIYPTGNLLVQQSVSEMTGVFKAKGNFYTCVANDGTILHPNDSPVYDTPGVGHHMTYIVNNCQTKLTVYGSVTAEQMYLYRVTKKGVESATVGEGRNSGNLAEAFVFSPEVYLAYLSAHPGGAITVGSADSIVALPPVY